VNELEHPLQAEPVSQQPEKKPYMVFYVGDMSCKTDIDGLEFDFNYGARVKVPKATGE